MIVSVTEEVANALYLDAMWEEAKLLWGQVVSLLEQNNVRIIQRKGRLKVAKDNLRRITNYLKHI